jgi:hypothetical protein
VKEEEMLFYVKGMVLNKGMVEGTSWCLRKHQII